MKRILLTAVSFLTLVACAPQKEERHFQGAKTEFKPNYEDVDLRKDNVELNSKGSIEFSGGYSHGSLYRFSENLFILGKSLERPQLMSLGVKTRQKIQATSQDSKVYADKSPYIDYLISKSQSAVGDILDKVDQDLLDGQNEIVNLISDINKKFAPDAPAVDIASGVEYVKQYLRELNVKIEKTTVMPDLKKALTTELEKKFGEIDSLHAKIQTVLADGGTFPSMLDGLFVFLKEQKIELPADFSPMIEQAKAVSADLVSCQTPQEGLTVIVDVWMLLDEKDRKTYFQEISPALYKELSKSSQGALSCLRDENCKNFFRNLKKNLFILPELKKFGVEKICHEIDVNAQVFVKNLLQTEVAKILVKAPEAIPGQIVVEITKKRDYLKFVKANFPTYFRDRFMNWADSKQLTSIMLNPKGKKNISLSGQQITMTNTDAGDLDLFEALGPASAAAAQQADLKTAFEMMSRMASVSDIIMKDKNVRGQPITNEFRNTNQAEILRGLSQIIRFLRDWEASNFDQTLGLVTAQDLLPEMDLGENNQTLFPKADLYALSISTAAQFIKNIQSSMSPVFTMNLDQKINWQDKKDDNETVQPSLTGAAVAQKQPEVLAGIVEINNGQRSHLVKTAHLTRWIIAVSEFLAAIDGAEKSASTDLHLADKDGKTPLDELTESKKTLREMIFGMSNFLSYEMVDERGLFAASFDIQTLKKSSTKEVSVLDQALAIRALLTSSAVLKMSTYQVAAIDGYYKLNTLFQSKQHFYQNSKDDPNAQLPVVLEMLRTLSVLEPHLPEKSADQLRWIMEPWLTAIENLKY